MSDTHGEPIAEEQAAAAAEAREAAERRAEQVRLDGEVANLEAKLAGVKTPDGKYAAPGEPIPDEVRQLKLALREARLRARAARDGQEVHEDHKGRLVAVDPDQVEEFLADQERLGNRRSERIARGERKAREQRDAAVAAARQVIEEAEAADAATTPETVGTTAAPTGGEQ